MYEYIRPKQASDRKSGAYHDITQRRKISFGDSYADRNTKMGFRPSPEKGGVIQREKCRRCNQTREQCQCWEFEPADNKRDRTYRRYSNTQYLDSNKLRKKLGAPYHQGEAHHIIPGSVVERQRWVDNGIATKSFFNEDWNGILLNGYKDDDGNIVNEVKYSGLDILHRKNGMPDHPTYNRMVNDLINECEINNKKDCKHVADYIRDEIEEDNAECLDDMNF